jgi:peptidyl-tRNA hydrolase
MIRIINSSLKNEVGMNNSGVIAAINKYNSDNKGGVLMYDYLFSSAGVDKLTFSTSINGIKIIDNHYEYEVLKNTTD